MLSRLARLATTRARWVLAGAVALLAVAGILGGDVAGRLTTGGFEDPAAESARAEAVLADQFRAGSPNVVLLATAAGGDVDAPEAAAAGRALTDRLAAEDGVTGVASYWSEGNAPPLRSEGGDRALVVGRIEGDDDRVEDRIAELAPRYAGEEGPLTVAVGGEAAVFLEISEVLEDDLLRAEMIALPVTLVLLVMVFGSVVAAGLPLVTGVLSIMGTFLVLRVMTELTDVSVYALNLTTALGLGLAIDYSLFIVSRYREELAAGHEPGPAVTRTVRTAGRTVAFSALTVAASLLATLAFPLVFLRSFAYAGVAVALLAGLFSVLVLPALLYVLGHRVNAGTVRRRAAAPRGEGAWHRVATVVMRRPLPIATAAIALLLFLGAPFLGIDLGATDDRVLPADATSRRVSDVLRDEFASTEAGALSVVATDTSAGDGAGDGGPSGGAAGAGDAVIDDYATHLAGLAGVARVDAATGTYCGAAAPGEMGCEPGQLLVGPEASDRYAGFRSGSGTYLSVVPAVDPYSPGGEALVDAVRSADAPFPVQVTGPGAVQVDTDAALFDRLPLALGLIALITVVLLFMMFGSVVIPAKAVVLNLLSLSATFGAMVWVFQDGHLSGALDFTATGTLASAMPILMFCVAFGLSMDYEVFLLSRIKEEHDRGHDTVGSVARGLERTGRIVTAAAVLIAVVFVSFALGHISFMKLFGLGLTLAVLLDAFVIRAALVPAFMRLAGEWNWWAPAPLRRFHRRWGISEHVDLDAGEPAAAPAAPAPVTAAVGAGASAGNGAGAPGVTGNGHRTVPGAAPGRDPGAMTDEVSDQS